MDQILSAVTVSAACILAIAVLILVVICSRLLSMMLKLSEGVDSVQVSPSPDHQPAYIPSPTPVASPVQPAQPAQPAPVEPVAQVISPVVPPAPLPQPVNLHGVDDKTAAMLMAIVAYKAGVSPDALHFVSIREC